MMLLQWRCCQQICSSGRETGKHRFFHSFERNTNSVQTTARVLSSLKQQNMLKITQANSACEPWANPDVQDNFKAETEDQTLTNWKAVQKDLLLFSLSYNKNMDHNKLSEILSKKEMGKYQTTWLYMSESCSWTWGNRQFQTERSILLR